MRFHVLTLFPELITQAMQVGIIGRALVRDVIQLEVSNIRDYTQDKHGKVDDYPYGGGAGMLMQAQPVFDAWKAVAERCRSNHFRTIYLTPQGRPFDQTFAQELSREEDLIFLCGHYEGIDERVTDAIVTDNVSIGDYILTGGELPALVMMDAIARLVPGVLNNEGSATEETFHQNLLEYPQYTRPAIWRERSVPEILLSGDHAKIKKWREQAAAERTRTLRPDLYERFLKEDGSSH
jgi:tRNA (guanine37-N1)-methyltransferase